MLQIHVTDTKQKKEIYDDFGEMMFTHYGVTGPMILSASSHMRNMEPNRYQISIDLKPALSLEQLDKRLQKILQKIKTKILSILWERYCLGN